MLLEIGDCVRYRSIGAGRVIAHTEREFKGQKRLFATIEFPHRSMSAQVPIGDPAISKKLSKVVSKTEFERVMRLISKPEKTLPRTWDQREEMGTAILRTGEPKDWVGLLASYALAASKGVSVASSDGEIVLEAQELLAAEWAAISGEDFKLALELVNSKYNKAATVKENLDQEVEATL